MPELETWTATAPSAWASYLINGDATGIGDAEQAECDAWIAGYCDGCAPVSCEDAGFIHWHDARGYALPADCQTYTFVRPA